MRTIRLSLFPLVLACSDGSEKPAGSEDTGSEPSTTVGTTSTGDADGDGFSTGDGDCDDTDASVYPGGPDTSVDGVDQDCDGEADVEDALCSADLTVTLPDGSTTALDFCAEWDFSATFEYDPDDPPEITALTVSLSATTEVDFECEVRLSQEAVCGTGFYSQLDGAGIGNINHL